MDLTKRLSGGLQKLIQASQDVEVMKEELGRQQLIVQQKSLECNELLDQICLSLDAAY